MCGLFGHVRPGGGVSLGTADAALRALAHRGPDQQGDWSSSSVYIGHRRLSILDLSERARQPFVSEDGAVVVAVNGEIYNYQLLRRELAPAHQFRTTSDSEVVLHGYRQWGIRGLLDRLEGMYAFCIHDSRQHRLFLARDRVGIKPLYYSTRGNGISWASELKALEAFLGAEQLEQDRTALYDFLTYLYVPSPKSMYKDVFKLEPAHYIEVDVGTGSLQKRCYWQLAVDGLFGFAGRRR